MSMTAGVGGLLAALGALRDLAREGVQFEMPAALLLVVPALVAAGLAIVRQRAPVLRVARAHAAVALPRGRGHTARIVAVTSSGLAAVLVAIAAGNPVALGQPDPALVEGIDIVLALDVSGSMRAADFRPNDRLSVAKRVIDEHVLSRPRDRVGLVVFAGEAFTQAPLTQDKTLLRDVLDGVRTGVIKDGTAIGDGLALALARLQPSHARTKTVILLTDGDNNAGALAPETAADLAKQTGVKVFTILVGKGGRVPFPDGVDIFGAPRFVNVDMPVNPALLKQLATTTGGAFYQATDKRSLESSFQQVLESLDRSVLDGSPLVRRHIPLAPLLLVPALLLLLVSFVLRVTRASTVP